MALRGDSRWKNGRNAGKQDITVEEFKNWLMKFDLDKDGRISKKELRLAFRNRGGGWLSWWKSGGSVHVDGADFNESGYIDEHEIDYLLDFAEKSMGFKFYN